MPDEDLRALLDPIAAVLAARPRYRDIPETIYQPPADEDGRQPDPVIYPARTELYVDPADLPAAAVSPNGDAVSLGAQLALVQSMLAWVWDEMQFRSVTAQHVLDDGPYLAGRTLEVPVTWDETPQKTPTSASVTINAPIAWLGRTSARVNPGSVTVTGATVVVTVHNAISPGDNNPITYDVTGTYFWVPPYQQEPPQ